MRQALKVLGWAAGALGALAIALALSIPIDGAIGGGRVAAVANTVIDGPGGAQVRAYVARPGGAGPHPAVIMVHEWWGLTPEIAGMADALAAEGYVVIAPDVFRGSSTGWIPRAIYQVSSTPPEQVNADLDIVRGWLAAQPDVIADRIGVIGFCFGGRTALRYSLHNPAGVAATGIFYGMATTDPAELRALRAPVLGVFGGADSSIPQEEVQALDAGLRAAGVPSTITVYPGQPHAFVSDVEAIARPGAAQQAWGQLLGFLRATLRDGAASAPPAAALAAWAPDATTPLGAAQHALMCRLWDRRATQSAG